MSTAVQTYIFQVIPPGNKIQISTEKSFLAENTNIFPVIFRQKRKFRWKLLFLSLPISITLLNNLQQLIPINMAEDNVHKLRRFYFSQNGRKNDAVPKLKVNDNSTIVGDFIVNHISPSNSTR